METCRTCCLRSRGMRFEASRAVDHDGERLEALYVLALTTGLRRGELLALRWDDIDLGSRQLHVCRAMQRVDGKLQIFEPKTSSSRRTVVLPRYAMRHLQEHKKRQDAERWAMPGGSTGWCSPHPSARRSSRATSTGAGMSCGERLACPGSGCMTCGTGVPRFAKNVPDRVIMEVLGHAEIGVTMNTYAHVLPVLRQEAADAIDELFGA